MHENLLFDERGYNIFVANHFKSSFHPSSCGPAAKLSKEIHKTRRLMIKQKLRHPMLLRKICGSVVTALSNRTRFSTMVDLKKISENKIKNVASGEIVPLESLWKNQTVVIVFFRRWGCLLCRVWAKEVSAIAPILTQNNIKLIGVGVADFDTQEFVDGKFFKGDLYVDIGGQTYGDLGFKRFNYFSIITSLFTGESRAAIHKGKNLKLGGNFKGDGLQNGGALVVKSGGELLYSFYQERPAEHVKNSKFLEVLGLPVPENIDSKVD